MSESATTQRHPSWLQLKQQLEASWPSKNRRSVGVVVGCSGGADSIALLRCLAEIRNQVGGEGFLVAAHFNHRLRGEASDGDERFVSDAASVLNVSFVSESNQSAGGAFDEATLRNQRYAFFRNTLQRTGARYLALAHSADDNVETVLHHFMRGTGPAGLTGMSAFREFGPGDESDFIIARPLLRCRRELIRAALREREQSWREDASNTDDRYSRNWIRRQLLPLIESRYPVAIESITRTIESQNQWHESISGAAGKLIEMRVQTKPDFVAWDIDPTGDEAVVIEACRLLWRQMNWPLQAMSAAHWKRLSATIAGKNLEPFQLPGTIDVRRVGDHVTLSRC